MGNSAQGKLEAHMDWITAHRPEHADIVLSFRKTADEAAQRRLSSVLRSQGAKAQGAPHVDDLVGTMALYC
jgi:hypothetical protein